MKLAILTFSYYALLISVSSAVEIDFVRDIRPIFEEHCYDCHGPDKQKSGLRLDVKAAALKGGDYHRPTILPNEPDESALLRFILLEADTDDEPAMPPKGPRLSTSEIATIRAWIEQGAIWPDGVDAITLDDPLDHWAFQPVEEPSPPATGNPDWPRNEIDRFILHRLHEAGLSPNPEADRVTWLRRVTFDLTGLPPTPEAVANFVADSSEAAFARVVDRLLASTHYGERWAQHWLDLVRYADTHGYEVNTPRANAWPYRDYVIYAFNADTPYDQFIREQIAGDHFGKQEATGFLVTAAALLPGQIGKDDASKRLARQDDLGEILNNVGEAFLGLSIGCARCHDHKFDPVTAEDYYELQAFFAGVEYGDVALEDPDKAQKEAAIASLRQRLAAQEKHLSELFSKLHRDGLKPPVSAVANVESFAPVKTSRVRFTIESTCNDNLREPCIDEFEIFNRDGENVALAGRGVKVTASGSRTAANRHELKFVNDGVYGNSRSWMGNAKGSGWLQFDFPDVVEIERIVWGRDRQAKFADRLAETYRIEYANAEGTWQLLTDSKSRQTPDQAKRKRDPFSPDELNPKDAPEIAQLLRDRAAVYRDLDANASDQRSVFSGRFKNPEPQFVLLRGDPEQPQHEVPPAAFEFLTDSPNFQPDDEQARRLAAANWIASPDNPLTARVMVNRIWQWHFGTGIVNTPNDFGNSGAAPSHPELLDWLAQQFIHSGWSMKQLHRLIVLSSTYRQSNLVHEAGQTVDAGTRLLWRFPSRRLEGEAIRDSILAVSGRLNPKTGGPGFDLFKSRGGLSGFPPIENFTEEGRRRLIYAHKIRMERDIIFGAFDCPDAGQSMPARKRSTTPIQALNLFNSHFTADESRALAERVRQDTEDDLSAQIDRLWMLAFSRLPQSDIRTDAEALAWQHGLESLCRAVFNSNEFLFLP